MTKLICTVILIILLVSCRQQANKKHKNTGTTTKDNISTTISTDTSLLAGIIDITIFKPIATKFKYTFINNSGQKERLSVPGPSDYYLEGLLYFDTPTFTTLKTKCLSGAYYAPSDSEKQHFYFEWLDNDIKKELLNSDTSHHGHIDACFGLGHSGKLWLLNNKVLLTKTTN